MSAAFDHTSASASAFYDYLVYCSNAYYNTGAPIVSDDRFDFLVSYYETKFKTPFQYLGKATNSKIKLPLKMPSLNKIKDQHSIQLFLKSTHKLYHSISYVASSKIDGVSCLFVRSKGKAQLMTRGDGSIGSDISHLLPYLSISSIKPDITIRGELVLYREDIKRYFEEDVPRNIVSGLVNGKNQKLEDLSRLRFIGYFVPELDIKQTMSKLQSIGVETPWTKVVPSNQLNEENLKRLLLEQDPKSPYDIDGLVVTCTEVIEAPSVDNPKYAVAFKIQKDTVQTKVVEVEWNPSRYGQLCPRVQLEPIVIGGVTITYATAFHAKFVIDNNIGPDTLVSIVRSGDVIPYIVSVDKPTKPQLPQYKWKWISEVHIGMENPEDCKQIKLNKLIHFIETLNIKGFKEAAIQKLIGAGFDSEDKLLFLTLENLLQIPSLTGVKGNCTKTCEKIAQGLIVARNQITLAQAMIGSSLFPAFGEKKIGTILQAIDVVNYLVQSITPEQKEQYIVSLNQAGIKTLAPVFIDCLDRFKHQYLTANPKLFALLKCKPKTEPVPIVNEAKKGIIVFTGFRDAELKGVLEKRGYTVASSISGKTTAIVCTNIENRSSKMEEAIERGILIVQKDQALVQLL